MSFRNNRRGNNNYGMRNNGPTASQSQAFRYNDNPTGGNGNLDSRVGGSFVQKNSQLYMGDLDCSWDENTIRQIWSSLGESSVEIKLMWRSNAAGFNAGGKRENLGYCFLDFPSYSHASNALLKNGIAIPGFPSRSLKLNWASSSTSSYGNPNNELSIFVGDLAPNVTESELFELFISRYTSTEHAKVVYDQLTGVSKGYAFIRFGNPADQQRALAEMQGVFLKGRAIRVSSAGHQHQQNSASRLDSKPRYNSSNITSGSRNNNNNASSNSINSSQFMFPVQQEPALTSFTDPYNTTVFIGGLSSLVTENELRLYFQPFGQIVYVKIPIGKGCGFVQYVDRTSAELAISRMQGFPIGDSRVRMSWGRSAKQATMIEHAMLQDSAQAQPPNQYQVQPQPALKQPTYAHIPSSTYYHSNFLQFSTNASSQLNSNETTLLIPGSQSIKYAAFPQNASGVQSPYEEVSALHPQYDSFSGSRVNIQASNFQSPVLVSDQSSYVNAKLASLDRLENGSNGFVFA